MPSLVDVVARSGTHAWLYLPIALLLGALHGLEPGHSKTMMAAFIVAVRGTVGQAVLLGLSAAFSHTAVVWLVALGGQYLLRGDSAQTVEPYFQIVSALLVLGVAIWMLWRIRAEASPGGDAGRDHLHPHTSMRLPPGVRSPAVQADEDGGHHHHHQPEVRRIDTGHGTLVLEIFEDGVPPRWRARFDGAPQWAAAEFGVVTRRPDGGEQLFAFAERGDYLESLETIPEPHAFAARVSFGHSDHLHAYELAFAEPQNHHHGADHHSDHPHGDHPHGDHPHGEDHHGEDHHGHHHHGDDHGHDHHGSDDVAAGRLDQFAAPRADMDAHERAHASQIARQFTHRDVSTGQIVAFGLTGGLIPCPAAITVLLLCLQLKRFALAAALVFCFSIGVAVTMIAAGVVAALGVRHVRKRWAGFDALARRAPYASVALMIAVATYMGATGWRGLPHG